MRLVYRILTINLDTNEKSDLRYRYYLMFGIHMVQFKQSITNSTATASTGIQRCLLQDL
jgi:hypothetical protein